MKLGDRVSVPGDFFQRKLLFKPFVAQYNNVSMWRGHVDRVGAATATCLHLTEPWKGTGSVVLGDSCFDSVKPERQLLKTNGLYSIILVKTTYKDNPNLAT